MKKISLILFIVILMSVFSSPVYAILHFDVSCKDNVHPANKKTIKYWGKIGDICKVYGHMWNDTSNKYYFSTYTVNVNYWDTYFPPTTRHCPICDKKQVERVGETVWVDIKEDE